MPGANYPFNEPGRNAFIENALMNRPHRRQQDYLIPDDEIEVIDLDDNRRQIKPTTWH